MNGTEWSMPSPYEFQMEGYSKAKEITLTDNGEPGVVDRIGVTLYNGSTLLYSSSWPMSSTEELTLVGGNILVNDGIICNASDITYTVITSGKNPSLTGEDVTFTATVFGLTMADNDEQ